MPSHRMLPNSKGNNAAASAMVTSSRTIRSHVMLPNPTDIEAACDRPAFIFGSVMTYRKILGCSLTVRSEEHTSELQSRENLVCRLLLETRKLVYYELRVT